MVDCYMALTVQYAIALAKKCEDLNINWWEEVLHPDDIDGFIQLKQAHPDKKWTKTLQLVNETSEYALTGAVYSQDRYALEEALNALENAAGNFYINDKPTGAVVGQQPFGGARGSGTNDKAGSASNLLRWVSPRLIKETFVPAKDYRYPFLGK